MGKRMVWRLAAVAVTLSLLLVACGSGEESAATEEQSAEPSSTTAEVTTTTTTTAPATTTTAAPSTTAPLGTLPSGLTASGVKAPIGVLFNGADPAKLLVEPNVVTAHWYRVGERYAVVYAGLDPGVGVCVGYFQTLPTGLLGGWASTPTASCEQWPTFVATSDDEGIRVCGDQVSFVTQLASDKKGPLAAQIGNSATGGAVVMSGQAFMPDPTLIPNIDVAELSC